jgi:vitamin B12 transporter
MKFLKLISLAILSSSVLAEDNTSLEHLLGEFTEKSDLSKKTKIDNVAYSIIFTRNDIERMQARNLKDIVKSLPLFTYQENRFGISNLNTLGDLVPFSSSSVRVYLDDHEMVSGIYGSGFALFGNVELDFVDHIEVYYNAPSFEYSVESTSLLIKLHTKTAQRDNGGKLLLSNGSNNFNQQSAFYTDTLNDISYFAYVSNLNDKRDNPVINGNEISKDKDRKHFLGTISDKYNHLLMDTQYVDVDPLLHTSINGSAEKSLIETDNYQLSYINTYFDNVKIKASYQKADNNLHVRDDNIIYFPYGYDYQSAYSDAVYSSEINYGFKNSLNSFFIGANARMKEVDVKYSKINGINTGGSREYNRQNIYSAFVQDELSLNDNSIISGGIKYSTIDNNGNVDDHDFGLYRIGYIYNKEDFTAKVFYYHTPNLIEPYLYTSWFSNNYQLKPELSNIIYSQLEYKNNNNYFSFMLGQNKQENALYYNPLYSYNPTTSSWRGSIDNYDDIKKTNFVNFEYKYDFNSLNSVSTNYFINFINDAPLVGDYKEYGSFVRFLNTIDKFDIFNELIYRENSIKKHAWFDYSTGIKYKYSDNLFLSVKGENLFNTAYKDELRSLNYAQTIIGETSPIDRRIYTTLEYMF